MDSQPVSTMEHVYSGRTLLPMKTTELQVPILNTRSREVTLQKGTLLGKVFTAKAVTTPTRSSHRVNQIRVEDTISPAHEGVIEKMVDGLPSELTDEQREKVPELLMQYRTILSTGDHDVGRTPLVEHTIDTGDHKPVRQPLRRQPFQHQEYIDEETNRMLEYGIIEPAASLWASNVVLVKKKDGSLRFCVDYRRLNSITYKDSYPLPLIDNCLNALAGSSWYSMLDLRSGYYNIPIAESDRDKSAFITRQGCFRFTVMPFGLTCAPSVFQRMMDVVLCGLSYQACLVYLDDYIFVFGRTFDEQMDRLREVFSRLKAANLKLQPSKCFLCQRSVEFSGHVVSEKDLAMQPSKIEAINEWTACQNVHEVRAFMGLSGYYRRFIKDFLTIATPLYNLTRKESEFRWTTECQEAFNELIRRLTSEPTLALPSDEGTYVLDTDASDFGLGAILSQRQDDQEKVIAYASRTLAKPEQKYETTRKELLAILTGLKQFPQYLLGRHFVIRTDHAALTWLRRTAEPMPQLARWLTFIEQFDYKIEHRPGAKHGNADGLSRRTTQSVRVMRKEDPTTPVAAKDSC